MEPVQNVVVWLLIFALCWVVFRIHTWYVTDNTPNTKYFCPAAEQRVLIDDHDGSREIVWKDGVSAYGMECEVCGSVHVWDLDIAPCPIYQGDKIRFRITTDGLVQTK